jgi:NADH:ubiquinone oxidoreductase subunit K
LSRKMTELIDYVIVSIVLVAIGIYGLVVKRNAVRMLFALEIIANAANLNLIAFSRNLSNAQGQVFALFSIAIAAAEVAVGLGIIIIAYRLYKEIDVEEFKSMRG